MSSAFAVFKTAASQLEMKYIKIHLANNKLAIIIIIMIMIMIMIIIIMTLASKQTVKSITGGQTL